MSKTLSGFVSADGRKLWLGKFRALVIDNMDPDKLCRLQCVCPEIAAAETLRWALPVVPYGTVVNALCDNPPERGQGFGIAWVPEIGSMVWIEFEGGDINRPLWVGVCYNAPKDAATGKEVPNVPAELTASVDPDTGDADYPKEKTLKSERWSGIATRKIRLQLDADTSGVPVWDAAWLGKSQYDKPHVTLGRDGNTDEGGRNVVDIDALSRDLRLREDRDRHTIARRDIHDEAGRNVWTFAGQNQGGGGSPEGWGYIVEHADTAIEMRAEGAPGGIDSLRDRLKGDAPLARVRFSSGAEPQADGQNPREASAAASNLVIKLTGHQYALLQATLETVIIKSGVDTYVRAANGFHVETSSTGGAGSARASQLHYLGSGAPATGGPANESGRPAPYGPEGTGTRTFLRCVDERAIIAYNYHQHEVIVPKGDDDDEPGEGGDPELPPIGIGDFVTASFSTSDYGTFGDSSTDSDFDDGFIGQVENIVGTAGATATDEYGTYGFLDLMASHVDALTKLVTSLSGYATFADALIGHGIGAIQLKSDDWSVDAQSMLNIAAGSAAFPDMKKIAGPKIKATEAQGIPVAIRFLEYVPTGYSSGGAGAALKSAVYGPSVSKRRLARNSKSHFAQVVEDVLGKRTAINVTGTTMAGSGATPLHGPSIAASMLESGEDGGETKGIIDPFDSPYQGLPTGLPSDQWKCGSIVPTLGYALSITSTPCPPNLWQVQDVAQPPLQGAATASFEGQAAVRVSTEFARAN